MMSLGDVWRDKGREMIFREMVNQLGKETQGKNKARRKCTCQTEQQQLASSSVSYVTALWSADRQVRGGKRERYGKVGQFCCFLLSISTWWFVMGWGHHGHKLCRVSLSPELESSHAHTRKQGRSIITGKCGVSQIKISLANPLTKQRMSSSVLSVYSPWLLLG